jgi:hypothetical protein
LSPGALQNSQGNSQGAADPSSETLRLLKLAIEEEDDATSKLAIPRSSRLSHGLGQEDQNLNAELQLQGEDVTQQSLGHEMLGDYGGEVADVANALFNDQVLRLMYPHLNVTMELFDCIINHVKELAH